MVEAGAGADGLLIERSVHASFNTAGAFIGGSASSICLLWRIAMQLTLAYLLLANVVVRQGVIESLPHPIFVKDTDSRFVLVNEAMCELMGSSTEMLVGKTDYDFVPKEQADIFRANDILVLETGEPNENEELLSDPCGRVRDVITRKHRVTLPGGARFLVGCITDITELRESERRAWDNAMPDSLTDIRNRILLQRAIEEARAAAMQLALACFDPRGHLAGGELSRCGA
jgi:PAS domain S-box-containing protein